MFANEMVLLNATFILSDCNKSFSIETDEKQFAKCLNEKDMVMAKANKNKYQLQAISKKMLMGYFLIFLFHLTSRLFLFSLSHTDMGQYSYSCFYSLYS